MTNVCGNKCLISKFVSFIHFSFNVCEGDGQRYHLWGLDQNQVRDLHPVPSYQGHRLTNMGSKPCAHLTASLYNNPCLFLALSSWKPPRYILNMPVVRHDRVRKKYHILVEGDTIPPPIKSFREMKFPQGKGENTSQTTIYSFTQDTGS